MDGHGAIAIGLLTIDGNNYHAFNSAQSELHPVYALFIHLSSDPTDDTWAFFVRNSGDEGYCGNSQHWLFTGPAGQPQPIKVFIPMAGATGLTFLASSKVNKSMDLRASTQPLATNVVTGNGATLTFSLGDPLHRGWIEGELHLKWDLARTQAFRRPVSLSAITPGAAPKRNSTTQELEGEAPVPTDLSAIYAKLGRQGREQYLKRAQSLAPLPRPSIRIDVQTLNASVAVGKVARGSGGQITSSPDPEAAAREQKYVQLLKKLAATH
jgi:hypothetical protein